MTSAKAAILAACDDVADEDLDGLGCDAAQEAAVRRTFARIGQAIIARAVARQGLAVAPATLKACGDVGAPGA